MSDFLKNFADLLREVDYTGLTFLRPDTSGIRGQGVARKAYQSGDEEFPYGEGDPDWGEPWAYSRDSAGHGPSHRMVPTPKNVDNDDDRWSDDIDEMGAEGWTSGTPPQGNITEPAGTRSPFGLDDEEDDIEEALGVPFNVAKAGQGGGGAHTGGRVMPGTGGSWSSGPTGGHWDDILDDEDLEDAGSVDEYSYGMPFAGDIMNRARPRTSDTVDSDLPPFVPDHDDQDDRDVGMTFAFSGFGTTPGSSHKHSRAFPGRSWKESVHRVALDMFVESVETGERTIADRNEALRSTYGLKNDRSAGEIAEDVVKFLRTGR